MICKKCGCRVSDTASYCIKCGAAMNEYGISEQEFQSKGKDNKKKVSRKIVVLAIVLVALLILVKTVTAQVQPINVQISAEGHLDNEKLCYVDIQTNLPDDTVLMVTMRGTSEGENGFRNRNYEQSIQTIVNGGTAQTAQFSNAGAPLIAGNYEIEVTIPYEDEPRNVQKVLGSHMCNVKGDLVQEQDGDIRVSMTTAYTMPDLRTDLTADEDKLFTAGMKYFMLQRKSSLNYGGTSWNMAVQDLVVSSAVRNDTYGVAWMDYDLTMQNVDTKETIDSSFSDAMIILEKTEKTSQTNLPVGYILDDTKNEIDATTYFVMRYDISYTYSQEELDNINRVLAQISHWMVLEKDAADQMVNGI